MTDQDEALLNEALSLFRSGQYEASEKTFQQLQSSQRMEYRALAGLGMIRLAENRIDEASSLFEASLRRQVNADALYGLGYIEELGRNFSEACSLYERALQRNPSHVDARKRLQNIQQTLAEQQANRSRVPSQQSGWDRSRTPSGTNPERQNQPDIDANAAVFYTILCGDPSELSQRTLQLIAKLNIENRRPRFSAYPLLVLLLLPAVIFFGIFLLQFYNLATVHEHGYGGHVNLAPSIVGLAIAAILLIVLFVQFVNMRRTRYFIKSGWIRVKRGHGFFSTDDKPQELTHIIDTNLKRSPWGLITNNGVLLLNFGTLGKMHLRGLASYKELEEIRADLINLSRMLRSNPALKGLIA
jgi:tetratricopeptide (TPR) repeat protein